MLFLCILHVALQESVLSVCSACWRNSDTWGGVHSASYRGQVEEASVNPLKNQRLLQSAACTSYRCSSVAAAHL